MKSTAPCLMALGARGIERFVKLMMLSTSDADQEALAALRKANAMLASAKINWADVLVSVLDDELRRPRRKSKPAEPPAEPAEPPPPPRQRFDDAMTINVMFATVYQHGIGNGGFAKFIESIQQYWDAYGFLTEKQFTALKNAAERHGYEDQAARQDSKHAERDFGRRE